MIGLELEACMSWLEYDIYSLIKAFYPEEEIKTDFHEGSCLIRIAYDTKKTDPRKLIITWRDFSRDREESRLLDIAEAEGEEERTIIKNNVKRELYRMLSEKTKKTLPWGTLTGIRPTKIPYAMLESGQSEDEISDFMKRTYLTGEEKIQLSIEIAKRERELLKKIDYQNGYSLYIGIPFCPTRCLYCSFPSYPIKTWKKRVDQYLDALCFEMEAVSKMEWIKGKRINTVYFGGGTPTTLEPDQMTRLLCKLGELFDWEGNLEFTVEAGRPDSITKEKLMTLLRYGVNRISVNPQTMNQKTLDLIGRQHTVQQTREAFWLARDCGFTNINMDMIIGLPGETRQEMEHTIQELAKLKPDSITVHSLALKRASRLNEKKEEYADYSSLNNAEISAMMERYAREMGLVPYYLYRQKNMTGNMENVGYAALDKAGIYNILIMEEKQTIVAMGAGGMTKLVCQDGSHIERADNIKSVEQYIDRIEEMIERKRKGFQNISVNAKTVKLSG